MQGAVRVLLEGKANPNTADKPMDETPLMEAGGENAPGWGGGGRRMTISSMGFSGTPKDMGPLTYTIPIPLPFSNP